MDKAVITIVGTDRPGIIAEACTFLTGQNINILNINQTIVDGFFTMTMIVDTACATTPFDTLVDQLHDLGKEMGVEIMCQKADVFSAMYRL